jgi:hypothetical protein
MGLLAPPSLLDVTIPKLYNSIVINQLNGLFMKIFIKGLVIFMACVCLSISYASVNLSGEYVGEEDEYDYEDSSVQTSLPETETREKSEYDVDMRPYVAFKYTSQKTKIERK